MEIRKTPVNDKNPYYAWTLQESTDYLRWILKEFPFGDWRTIEQDGTEELVTQSRSQAVQIAAMLSLFCMALIPRGANRMGFIYNANSQRSGKTLLAKLAIMSVCGGFRAQPWKGNEEDLNKVLDAEMLAGSIYICFDNVRGFMGSQTLEGLMTAPQWTGRVLGKSQMFTAENRMNLFITGNDCLVSPDMAHRCLICDLFVEQGDVQERQVENLIDEVWLMDRENRRNILSALWGLVRAWHEAGKPSASSFGFKPRLGFERWGEIIGGIVGYAGFGNPLAKAELDSAGDSEDRNIKKLIERMRDEELTESSEGRLDFSFQQIVDFCHEDGLFDWILDGRQTENGYKLNAKSSSKFGLCIKKYFPPVKKNKNPRRHRVAYAPLLRVDGPERGRPIQEFHYVGSVGEGRHKKFFIEWMPIA